MQEGEPKNGYREQEAAGGTYAPKRVPELERQRQARIKRLQELERQQIELHKQRIINGTLSRRYNARAYDGLTAIVAFLTAVLLLPHQGEKFSIGKEKLVRPLGVEASVLAVG